MTSSTTPNTNPVGYVSEKTYSRGDAKQELREKIGIAIFGGRVLPINWETDSRLERVAELISATAKSEVNKVLDEVVDKAIVEQNVILGVTVSSKKIPLSAIEQVRKEFNND